MENNENNENNDPRLKFHKREIIKASVKPTEVKLKTTETFYDTEDQRYITNEAESVLRFLPAQDLKDAMADLAPYLAHLAEFNDEIGDPVEKFKVTGYTIGGDGEHEGVVLIGHRELRAGRVLNLVTPFTKWQCEHDPYEFADDLYQAIQRADFEVQEYVKGKCAPSEQLALDLDAA